MPPRLPAAYQGCVTPSSRSPRPSRLHQRAAPFAAPLLAALLCASLAATLGCGAGVLDQGDPDAGPVADAGPRCGDGVKNPSEECDLGAANGPNAGCEADCYLSCVPGNPVRGDAHCDPHDPCKGQGVCGGDHVCRLQNPLATGAICDTGKICRNGACQAPVCGDGIVTAPEECDDGANDGQHGCNRDCRFGCKSTDATRNCAPADPCQGASTCNDTTHMCSARAPLADGTSCGAGKACKAGVCAASACGNGVVEAGEQCDPPNGTTCDAQCQSIVHAVCGNGVLEPGEQCDDGNNVNLDGCDDTCHFEQDHRANSIQMQFATDGFCPVNAVGAAIGSLAQSQVQKEVDATVQGGSLTMGFRFLALADLTGTNAAAFKLGAIAGKPYAAPPLKTYDGTKDLDWWYTAEAADLDAHRLPVAQLDAKIVSKALTAGPGQMKIGVVLGAAPVALAASGVRVKADVGGTSAPAQTQGATPGHLPSEHLDPALVSFATLANGELCGNVSAWSLQQVKAPLAVQAGGSVACDEGYGPANTMLDVVARGCSLYGGLVTGVRATPKPDQVDPSAPVAGAGGPYSLALTGNAVTGCKDKKAAAVDLTTCLKAAAYSSFFKFATDRVVLK